MLLYDQVLQSPSEDERTKLFQRIVEIAEDQFYVVGVALPGDGYGIVRTNFRNTPEAMLDSGFYPDGPGPSKPEQYYFAVARERKRCPVRARPVGPPVPARGAGVLPLPRRNGDLLGPCPHPRGNGCTPCSRGHPEAQPPN